MRLRAVALGVAAAALAAAPAAAAGECDPPGSRTVKSNEQVRVYWVRTTDAGHDVWACLRRDGTRSRLGFRGETDTRRWGVQPIRLSGTLIGYAAWTYATARPYYTGAYRIRVRDLATGRLLHSASANGGYRSGHMWFSERLVMDRAGSVAWTVTGLARMAPTVQKVLVSDSTPHAVRVDEGEEVKVGSLRRTGRVVSWRHGDETRTVLLSR